MPRLPEFAEWAQEQGDASAIAFDKGFCDMLMQNVSPRLEGQIPVSRGQGQGMALRGGGYGGGCLTPSNFTSTLTFPACLPALLGSFLLYLNTSPVSYNLYPGFLGGEEAAKGIEIYWT